MPQLKFWFEFASSYSYLSVMRIEALARDAGVAIAWRPFLLGPIFKSQGWDTSPFNIYPAKGRYMVRDIERISASRGLAFRLPTVFPANGLMASRLAIVGCDEGWVAPFTRAVFEAEFARGEDISSTGFLIGILRSLGLDAQRALQTATQEEQKDKLRDQTSTATERGIFGAPTFETKDGELFWGDDRLEQALVWATKSS